MSEKDGCKLKFDSSPQKKIERRPGITMKPDTKLDYHFTLQCLLNLTILNFSKCYVSGLILNYWPIFKIFNKCQNINQQDGLKRWRLGESLQENQARASNKNQDPQKSLFCCKIRFVTNYAYAKEGSQLPELNLFSKKTTHGHGGRLFLPLCFKVWWVTFGHKKHF